MAMREAGYETIMINCNPETVSTDYDTSDKLYFEPVTLEDVLQIYQAEKPPRTATSSTPSWTASASRCRRAAWRATSTARSRWWPRSATRS